MAKTADKGSKTKTSKAPVKKASPKKAAPSKKGEKQATPVKERFDISKVPGFGYVKGKGE